MLSGLTHFKPYRDILSVLRKLLPFTYSLGSVLFICFYSFAVIGTHLWGGLINDNIKDELGADIPEDYVLNNFNDMMSGMITLFELLIVNNW